MQTLNREQTEQLVEDWCIALESDDYKQGRGVLEDDQNNFCCLGILCHVAQKKHPELEIKRDPVYRDQEEKELKGYSYGQEQEYHDRGVIRKHLQRCTGGVSSSIQRSLNFVDAMGRYAIDGILANDNDEGKTFKEIAQIIRDHKTKLFPLLAQPTE